ncbi:MAG TPA: hypothetical protein VNO55_25415 [Polyangia bacterium]|nr:hypothetical protein [Polyangia bacterium]
MRGLPSSWRSRWRSRLRLPLGLAVVVAAGALGGCAPKAKTPEEAYRRFSQAVRSGDGGALFDAVDPNTRWAWMSVQKWHREAYDIVLSNFPEGPARERELRRFQAGATATSGRELFRAEVAGTLPLLAPLVAADAKIEVDATGDQAAAVLVSGIRVPLRRGGNGAWGFAGLAAQAEEQKTRAYHDLEAVRASAADYERAAARAAVR